MTAAPAQTFGTLALDTGGIEWVMNADPHVVLRARRIFARAPQAGGRELRLTNTPENCRELTWFLDRYPLRVADAEALAAGERSHLRKVEALSAIVRPDYQPRAFPLAIPARDYQLRAAEMLLTNGNLLLADDVGLGKTVSAITALTDARTLPAVVVTLSFLPRQWRRELQRFAPWLNVHLAKTGSFREIEGRGLFRDQPGPDVIVLNYHKLAGWAPFLTGYCKSVIFDEVQELRRPESQKTMAATAIAAAASYRLGLSATPVYNYGGEFYHIENVLAPGVLGTYEEFCREWCDGHGDKPRLKDPAAFGTYLRENFLILRRTRRDVGRELPEVSRITHTIESDARELHRISGSAAELARIILARASRKVGNDERFTAAGQFDALLRQATGIAKAPYVADFVRLLVEGGERVLLYGWHREVYSLWCRKLEDLRPVLFTGSETPAHKQQAVDAFSQGESKVLIMSLRSGAGVDGLQGVCRTVVFGELDWSPGVHEQCVGRIHRDGQGEPVSAYFLVAEDGADPVMADVLGLKREQVEGIRTPDAPLVERINPQTANIRQLAEHFLNVNVKGGHP